MYVIIYYLYFLFLILECVYSVGFLDYYGSRVFFESGDYLGFSYVISFCVAVFMWLTFIPKPRFY